MPTNLAWHSRPYLELNCVQPRGGHAENGTHCLKPPPERPGSITVEKSLPGVESERRPRRTTTLNIYSGTMEFDQQSTGITTPIAPSGHQRRPHPRQLSSRFKFCPVAITSASLFTVSSILSRNAPAAIVL